MIKIVRLVGQVGFAELVGLAATPFTISAIPTWYAYLNKPLFSPPNWLFGPVWTSLYALMGISAFIVWHKVAVRKIYLIQLGLNFIWSIIFFGLHQPALAFVEIIFLWLAVYQTIKQFSKISKLSGYLLYPYLAWITFAGLLNFFIVALN